MSISTQSQCQHKKLARFGNVLKRHDALIRLRRKLPTFGRPAGDHSRFTQKPRLRKGPGSASRPSLRSTKYLRRHETKAMLADLAYLALAGFVAWGRFGPESFTG